jgi:hypothetical protein
MTDFSVMLDEKRFIGNPEAELRSLLELSDHEIESKLRHLAFAQKVTMLDHPESLFVPAFLREAVNAFKPVLLLVPMIFPPSAYPKKARQR